MNLRIMTPEELAKAYGTDLREAFPPAELATDPSGGCLPGLCTALST